MGRALYVESVAEAVCVAGGCERLAELLGVSRHEVERWCAGALPEPGAFLRLIELVTDPAARERR
jgi:DNA-binding transcriptional regulator YdaS (Cro superfamily)